MIDGFDFFPLTTRSMISNLFREARHATDGLRKSFNYPMGMEIAYDGSERKEVVGVNITAALAGFDKDEIEVTVPDDSTISIKVEKSPSEKTEETETCFNGISMKDSSISFATMKSIDQEKTTVSFVNGLLTVRVRFKSADKGRRLMIE